MATDRRGPSLRPTARGATLLGVALVAVVALVASAPTPGAAVPEISHQAAPADPQLPVDPAADPQRARDAADEILRGDEYDEPDTRDRGLIERIRRWIADRLPRLDGEGTQAGSELFSYLVLGALGIGALGAITYVLVGTRGRRRADDEIDAEVDVAPLRTTDEWEAEAARCESSGDHRGAVRARFRALTTALADRGLVGDAPGRTAGEMRIDVAERAPDLVAPFGAVADLFEGIWYGARHAGPEDSSAARELGRAALSAAPRRVVRTDPDDPT